MTIRDLSARFKARLDSPPVAWHVATGDKRGIMEKIGTFPPACLASNGACAFGLMETVILQPFEGRGGVLGLTMIKRNGRKRNEGGAALSATQVDQPRHGS